MMKNSIPRKFILSRWLYIAVILPCLLLAGDKLTVAIDVGHTKARFGAVSSRGVTEYDFNHAIASVFLEKIANTKNIDAFIVNPSGGKITLKRRTEIAAQKKADLFISLHHDSVQQKYISYWKYHRKKNHYSDKFSGYSIFVSNKNKQALKSYRFATLLGEQLKSAGFVPTLHHAEEIKGENRKLLDSTNGIYEFNDLVVLKTAAMPAVLLECGVIVNRKEELLLGSSGFRKEMADAILGAILEYSTRATEESRQRAGADTISGPTSHGSTKETKEKQDSASSSPSSIKTTK
ncbi:MAG TPA: N-acetylmuramoyl-L-alanine amidase [Epsilonproteobacteria bacterium]|nr:N-acetylmuramoyl-L-alanine amidase [Campylobacterota bacterium]HHH37171.1 N-acetylmuramoyl-L-alanine amidase [Campylobacterota bacterium]